MEEFIESRFSVIRYCPDELSGEIINVGVVLHSLNYDEPVLFSILDENSPKLKTFCKNQVDLNIYKSYKDVLSFYLEESLNLIGQVGSIQIGSPFEAEFLTKLSIEQGNKKMTITEPIFALTKDPIKLIENIFNKYVGSRYLQTKEKKKTIKKIAKEIFVENKLLNNKVKADIELNPINELKNIKVNIDFGYKNGVWNYLQTVPVINGSSKNTEWFAKTKFLKETVDTNTKVHLLYRDSDVIDKDTKDMIKYLTSYDSSTFRIDLDKKSDVEELISKIQKEAQELIHVS